MDFTPDINASAAKFGIRSTNVFLPDFFEPVEAIILVQHDKIDDVIIIRDTDPEKIKSISDQWTIENYGNLCVFPGIIDCNVHLHTNYDKEWDNVVTSTKLAAAGGVTTIVDNPIMTKTFETPEEYVQVLKERIETLRSSSNVDFGLFGVLEPKTEDVIQEMRDIGVLGLKCYLFNCLQSDIGYVYPEFLDGLLKNLSEHYPDLLLIFHPELATERELYLSSPCRLTTLENRLDMNFEIKSLELGGGANKGAYLEELEKSEFSDDLEDDDCPTPSLDTPSKLKSKIKKAKEKTEINQLVHFELMSYGYEENKMDADAYSSDSDLDLLDKSSQSPGLKASRISSQEKQNEKGGFTLDVNPVSVTKHGKRSLFKKEEIKEEDFESTPKSLLKNTSQHMVKKRSQFSSVRDNELDIDDQESPLKLSSKSPSKSPSKASSKLFYDDKSPITKSPVMKSPGFNERTPREKESTPASKKNRSSSLVITFHSRVTKLLETHAEEEEDLQSNGLLDTGLTKSSFPMYEKDHEFNDDSNKFSGGIRNILGSGLTKDESSGSEIIDSMKKINLMSDQDKTETSKSTNQYGFSPDSNPTPQDVKTSSLSSSPCFSNDQMLSQNSSLLQRRITRGTSLSIPIRRKGSVSIAPNNSLKLGNTEVVRSPVKTEATEQKFNTSYRIFLANRPQSWEENGVSWILSKFKPEMKLRILLQNLSLASSFLKIRQKKKSDQQFTKTLYGDTSTAYLFFNERAVKKSETKYKATPPFRDKENRKWLIENFKLDGIDMVSSYHFFVPQKYKDVDQGNFRRAFSGFESVGLNLQSVWTTIYAFYKKNNKRFNQEPFYQKKLINDALCKICKALCSNPAEFLKIDHQKGKIAKGKDADFVVWDPYKLINNQNLSGNHIFSKRILFGVVNKTYIRGKLVYDKENDAVVAGDNGFRAKFVTASSS